MVGTYVRDGDGLAQGRVTKIIEHVLDQERALSDRTVWTQTPCQQRPTQSGRATMLTDFKQYVVVALQLDLGCRVGSHGE